MNYLNGGSYVGDWLNNVKNGKGIAIFADVENSVEKTTDIEI